jgi:hypothetical protein
MSGIGLLNEKPLHASLKQWYARPGDRFEVPVDGFVIDLVRDDLLIEIQTRNFFAIKSKLTKLVRSHSVRLIYPIVQEKWIVRLDEGQGAIRRKSPKRGRMEDLFWELVSIPQLLSHPNFSLEVLMIRQEEVRRYDGKRKWRRKKWVLEGRRLLEVMDQRSFGQSAEWLGFVPDGLESFTTSDLATLINTRRDLAQKMWAGQSISRPTSPAKFSHKEAQKAQKLAEAIWPVVHLRGTKLYLPASSIFLRRLSGLISVQTSLM